MFIGTLGRLCNGMEETKKSPKVRVDMTSCLDVLTCFTEFLDCGPKRGPDSSFADIYKDPKEFTWKRQWVDAICSMVDYINACEAEHPGNSAALLAQYKWADIQGKVDVAKQSVLAEAKKPVVKRGTVTTLRGLFGKRKIENELPAAHVLGQMRGLLLELGA